MVSNYGVVADGIVVNVVLSDRAFALEQGWVPLPDGVTFGWLYNPDNGFFPPPEPAPPSREEQEPKRAQAYREEADPIFFQAQRGKATQQDWLDKIAEIEARYPYPIA